MSKTSLLLLAALAVTSVVSSSQADTVFVGTPSTTDPRHDNYSFAGYSFTANAATVNELGYYVDPTDSTNHATLAVAHDVGLFKFVSGTTYQQVAGATIPAGSSATSGLYAFVPVSPVTLVPGTVYLVEAAHSTDLWGPNSGSATLPVSSASFGTLTGNGVFSGGSDSLPGNGNSLSFPNATGNGGYFGGNIGFVPEPGSAVLLSLAAIGLLFAPRNRRGNLDQG